MDLFSVFLNSLLSRAVDWAMGQILDVRSRCPVCGQRASLHIGNLQLNHMECSNCHKVTSQFTNACDFTISKQTLQIGHAALSNGSFLYDWVGFYQFIMLSKLVVPFNIQADGLSSRTLVLESLLRKFDDDKVVASRRTVLAPGSQSAQWKDHCHEWPGRTLINVKSPVLICDARILSEFRDVLTEHRHVIKPFRD